MSPLSHMNFHIHVGLFLNPYLFRWSIVYSCASIESFSLLWFCGMSISGEKIPPSALILKNVLCYLCLSYVLHFLELICHIPLKIVLELGCKCMRGMLFLEEPRDFYWQAVLHEHDILCFWPFILWVCKTTFMILRYGNFYRCIIQRYI